MNREKSHSLNQNETQLLRLASLDYLFEYLQNAQLEVFTQILLEHVQKGKNPRPIYQNLLSVLKHFEWVSEKTIVNYVTLTSYVIQTSSDIDEKRRLVNKLNELTYAPECLTQILEYVAKLHVGLCLALENLPKEETLPEKRRYIEKIAKLLKHPNTTSTVANTYAQALFNQMIDESELPQKRKCLYHLYRLFVENRGTSETLSFVCKALVNIGHAETESLRKRFYLHVLRNISECSRSTPEVEVIYSRGLQNALQDTKEDTERIATLSLLQNLLMKGNMNPEVYMVYVNSILQVLCETSDNNVRRHCIGLLLQLVEKDAYPLPEVFPLVSKALFNQIFYEEEITERRAYLQKLEQCVELSNFHVAVMYEFARALVNLAVDDPDLEMRKRYIAKQRELAKREDVSAKVILEVMKSLLNLALNPKTENRRNVLNELLELAEKDYSWQQETSEVYADFRCLYANAILLRISFEMELEAQMLLLQKMPPMSQIIQSHYFAIFGKIFNDLIQTEKMDITMKYQLKKVFQEYKDTQKNQIEERIKW